MASTSPTHDQLEAMRSVGDSLVDPLVNAHLAAQPAELGRLLSRLFREPGMPESDPLVSSYLAAIPALDLGRDGVILRGQSLFDRFGPEVLLALGSCALPLAYAAGSGVQVVARARRLKDDPVRRLCDTAQMVVNVMQPGQLSPNGIGWSATRKVRLIHSLVRYHVRQNPEEPWDPRWGLPINQEDQAGTLLTFSVGVLHGLRKMGARIARADADAYVQTWNAIGRLLGVDETLLPENEDEAADLALKIGRRQIYATAEGQDLTRHLLGAVETLFPLPGYAASLTYFFLEDTPFGADVAAVLGLPKPNWTRWLVALRAAQKRVVLGWLDRVPGAVRRRSFLARYFTQRMLLLTRPQAGGPFEVPERLRSIWGLPPARR